MPSGIWLYSYFALWLLLLVECAALVMILRQVARLHGHWIQNDPDWGLPLGSLAPALPSDDVYGRPLSFAHSRGKKTALFFLSPGCPACKEAMLRVTTVSGYEDVEVVLVVRGSELKTKVFVSDSLRLMENPPMAVVADPSNSIANQYKVVVVPYLIVIGVQGRVAAKQSAITLAHIGVLLGRADQLPLPGDQDADTAALAAAGFETAS